jgi:hypothetical protein
LFARPARERRHAKAMSRRLSPRCLLGCLKGDLVPKRCHRRFSQRCLPGRLGGDVMPKSCHRRLSLPCLPPSRHLPTGRARSWLGHRPRCAQRYRPADTCRDSRHTAPVDGHYTPQHALRNQSHGLAGCGEIRRGSRLPCSPQSVGWSGKLWRDSASKSPIVRNPSHGAAGCGEIRRGSRLPCSPQSFAWSGKPWRDSPSKSPIVRNPSHGLAGSGEIR